MSLLRFIRRDRGERPAPAAAAAPAPTLPPPAAPPAPAFTPPAPLAPPPVDMDRIRRELQEIQKIVGSDDTLSGAARTAQDAIDIDMRLPDVVRLCPQAFNDPDALQAASQTTVQVAVPGLFDQLTKGRVVTRLQMLTADIPPDYLSSYAAEHAEDHINLPLHLIVSAIQPEDLRRRTASVERDLGDKMLPNLFTPASIAAAAAEPAPQPAAAVEAPVPEPPPVAAPAASAAPVEPVAAVEPAAVAPPEPPPAEALSPVEEPEVAPASEPAAEESPTDSAADLAAEPVASAEPPVLEALPTTEAAAPAAMPPAEELHTISAAEPVALPPAAAPAHALPEMETAASIAESEIAGEGADEESPSRLLLSGLDLNSATAEEMHARLDGVGLRLAQRIVESRTQAGLFTDLYDLARVSGLRARRFERVTGLAWNAAYIRYRDQVKEMVGAQGGMPDVRQVATRFSASGDFIGCMIVHEDGLVLAQSWDHPAADALGAFAPQMFKKIHRYVKPLKLGEMNSLCFFVGHQPITVVRSGSIYFAALHKADRLTKKQVSLAQAVAMELGRHFARA